jgi:hypothetical protein
MEIRLDQATENPPAGFTTWNEEAIRAWLQQKGFDLALPITSMENPHTGLMAFRQEGEGTICKKCSGRKTMTWVTNYHKDLAEPHDGPKDTIKHGGPCPYCTGFKAGVLTPENQLCFFDDMTAAEKFADGCHGIIVRRF